MESKGTIVVASTPTLIDTLYTRTGLQNRLQLGGLRATKALGQNFLYDKNVIRALLDSLPLPDQGSIIEIGPGLGHLTWQLLAKGLNVTAIELDQSFIHCLQETDRDRIATEAPGFPSLNLIRQDALTVDFAALVQENHATHVIGNLPYNISVPLLFHLVKTTPGLHGIHVMVQKEVGERILAQPGSKNYGRLSIVLKYLCDITFVRTVPPTVFFPPPKIHSVFLSLRPKPNIDEGLVYPYLERLVMLGFRHRRKKIRSQLKNAIIEKRVINDDVLHAMEKRFDLDCRAEQFDVETWVEMAAYIRSQPPADA